MIRFIRARRAVIGTRTLPKIEAKKISKKSLRVIWCYS
jgi:hypothetical protein